MPAAIRATWRALCGFKDSNAALRNYVLKRISGGLALSNEETAMLPVPPFPAALPPAHDTDAPRAPDPGAPSDLVTVRSLGRSAPQNRQCTHHW